MNHYFKKLVNGLAKDSMPIDMLNSEIRFAVTADMALGGKKKLNPHVWTKILKMFAEAERKEYAIMLAAIIKSALKRMNA